jgi:hypothetical protein
VSREASPTAQGNRRSPTARPPSSEGYATASLGGRSSAEMSAAAVSANATQKVVANPRLDLTILDG